MSRADDTPGRAGHRFHRPALLPPGALDGFEEARLDPAVVTQVAHDTAAALVRLGRGQDDPEVVERLVALTEQVGLSTVAELWASCPARSLPGALWRLYALREWVRRDPVGASADYRAGLAYADVAGVVAGVATPPGPDEVRTLADAILRGVFEGDLAVALERAGAFCRVVSAGRASREHPGGSAAESEKVARTAASVLAMAHDLEAGAGLWRRGDLG